MRIEQTGDMHFAPLLLPRCRRRFIQYARARHGQFVLFSRVVYINRLFRVMLYHTMLCISVLMLARWIHSRFTASMLHFGSNAFPSTIRLVIESLKPLPADRKCFRMINGVLVERTVKDVIPSLQTNSDGLKQVLDELVKQYKTKQSEMDNWKVKKAALVALMGDNNGICADGYCFCLEYRRRIIYRLFSNDCGKTVGFIGYVCLVRWVRRDGMHTVDYIVYNARELAGNSWRDGVILRHGCCQRAPFYATRKTAVLPAN